MDARNQLPTKNRRTRDLATRWRLRALTGGGVGFAAVAAILMLAAPFSTAHGTVSFAAPFTGFTQVSYNAAGSTGCATAKNATPGNWNASTGLFSSNGSTHSGSCHAFSDGYVYSDVVASSTPFLPPFPGFDFATVTVSSSFVAHAAVKLTNTTNTSYGYAAVYLYVELEIEDVSNHGSGFVGFGYTYIVDQYIYGASGSYSLTQGWTTSYVSASGNLTAGHIYKLVIYMDAEVFTDTSGVGNQASASLNLAGTHGLKVTGASIF